MAVSRWDRDAVLMGAAAARVSFWPGIAVGTVTASCLHQRRGPPGYRFVRDRIPVELLLRDNVLTLTCPALTALDLTLMPQIGGNGIDTALRTRACTLADMRTALELTPGRPGNQHRALLLSDSRDEPWSEAERLNHRLFRQAGLTGWRSNLPDGSAHAGSREQTKLPPHLLSGAR